MRNTFHLGYRAVAYILLAGLLLQSCGNLFNPIKPQPREEKDFSSIVGHAEKPEAYLQRLDKEKGTSLTTSELTGCSKKEVNSIPYTQSTLPSVPTAKKPHLYPSSNKHKKGRIPSHANPPKSERQTLHKTRTIHEQKHSKQRGQVSGLEEKT